MTFSAIKLKYSQNFSLEKGRIQEGPGRRALREGAQAPLPPPWSSKGGSRWGDTIYPYNYQSSLKTRLIEDFVYRFIFIAGRVTT